MSRTGPGAPGDRAVLSAALKAVRKHRGLTSVDVAAGMNMPIRTYERFEAGEPRLNIDHLHRFALATDSDPYALLLAVVTASPDIAVRCANNKMATILTVGLQNFDADVGDRIRDLDARTLVAAVIEMFDGLKAGLDTPHRADVWLEDGEKTLQARRPFPGRQ